MKLLTPTGAVVDAAPEAAKRLMARGFMPADKPQTVKDEAEAEAPKPKPKKKK